MSEQRVPGGVTVAVLAAHLAELVQRGDGDVTVMGTGSDGCTDPLDYLPEPVSGRLYI